MKKKGNGYVDYQGESYFVELHWYEEPSVGKHKWKVKADDEYGGNVADWQHAKGKALLETRDGDRLAEVHWSQCPGVGKIDFFVK